VLYRLKPFAWPIVIALLASAMYLGRVADEMPDFRVYRTAGERVLHAEPLYQAADGHYQFKYLPAFAIGMTPFAIMRSETARVVWFAMSVGLLMALVRWSIYGLPERNLSPVALSWMTVLFMGKFYGHELTLGQANILLGTLLVGALLAVRVDQPRAAGILVGIAAFVKPYALILLPWLAVGYGALPVLAAVGVVATGLLLPAVIYGWSGNLDLLASWYVTVTGTTGSNLLNNDNVSFAAMWAKWIGPGTTAAVLAAATATLALVLVALVWRRRRALAEPEYLEWALLMLLIPLISPQGWDYVLLLGTPAVVCLVDRWRLVSLEWKIFFGAALALLGLTIFDLMGRARYDRFMAWSLISVAAVAVAGALAHLRWRRLA
jgi:hypothetical protein